MFSIVCLLIQDKVKLRGKLMGNPALDLKAYVDLKAPSLHC